MKMSGYYQIQKIHNSMYRITDVTGVCCYLAVGEKRAALLDTCNGFGNIREAVREVTGKEVIVLLSHGHLDHIGGAPLFSEVYMNEADRCVLKEHQRDDFRLGEAQRFIEKGLVKREDILSCEGLAPLPVEDGQCFDLGGLTVEMIALKGHTPGMMCPLLRETRDVIFGDACGNAVLLFDKYSSTVSEYREALLRMKQREASYDHIYRNHGSFESEKELLDNVIECCRLILEKKDGRYPVKVHGMDMFSVHKANGNKRCDGKEGNIFYTAEKAK